LLRHACPSSLDEIKDHIENVSAMKNHWVDFWVTVQFGIPDVEKMTPLGAADMIYRFRKFRDWLNGIQ
jgi:hypothetical protein